MSTSDPLLSTSDFGQLRAFVAVAEALNFTRAAEKLGVSSSALSQLVINLIGTARDGNHYLLRNATLTITGPDSVQVFHTEDQLFRDSLSANVPAGHYSALLGPGWRLERTDVFSSNEVNAELASDNPLQFEVEVGQRTVATAAPGTSTS